MFVNPFIKGAVFSLAVALIAGCSTHNIPSDRVSPNTIAEKRISLFVDQDGTFYPDGWNEDYGMGKYPIGQKKRYSVIKGAEDNLMEPQLRDYEAAFIQSVSNRVAGTHRIFILIHGFNNDQAEADEAFLQIEQKLDLQASDAVIWFHWDGMVGRGKGLRKLVEAGQIWDNAAGYSQLAGTHGLRDILNVIHNKEIVVITHSRGASVFLSALSNPPYEDDFVDDTTWLDVFCVSPLQNNGNTIRVIFLAPAIGQIDFGKTNYYTISKDVYRDLGVQLKEIRLTVNPEDPVLQKYVLPNDKFNPTGLGCDINEIIAVQEHYENIANTIAIKPYPLSMKTHDFNEYVAHKQFRKMLNTCEVP